MHAIRASRDLIELSFDAPPLMGRSLLTPAGIVAPWLRAVEPPPNKSSIGTHELGAAIVDPKSLSVRHVIHEVRLPAAQSRGSSPRRHVQAQVWSAPWVVFTLKSVAKSYEPVYVLAVDPVEGRWGRVDDHGRVTPLAADEEIEQRPVRGIDAFAWLEEDALRVHAVPNYVGDGDGESWPKESKALAKLCADALLADDPGLLTRTIRARGIDLAHPTLDRGDQADEPQFVVEGFLELIQQREPTKTGNAHHVDANGRVLPGREVLFVAATAYTAGKDPTGVLATFRIPAPR